MISTTAEIITRRRTELGLSQTDLADRTGVDRRQIARYEAAESQPTLAVARNLAAALGITIDELAGEAPTYTGSWFTCWEDKGGGPPLTGWVELTHRASTVDVGHTRKPEKDPDTVVWRAGLHADEEDLLGWFAIDAPTRTRGTLMLHRYGDTIRGTWVSIGLRSGLDTGSVGLGRTVEQAEQALQTKIAETAAEASRK